MMSVVVPCYWSSPELIKTTERCLDTLEKSFEGEIIVVDDGSPLKMERENTRVITRAENGGYAAAVNTGLAHAIGRILIVANNDLEFIDPYWQHHISKPLEQGYDICSIRTTEEGWETKDHLEKGAKFGSLWAMKAEVYEELKGLDESYGKGYFEDLDFQVRAEAKGFKVVKNHAGLVHHLGKATFKEIDPEDKHYYEAMEKFKKKHGRVF